MNVQKNAVTTEYRFDSPLDMWNHMHQPAPFDIKIKYEGKWTGGVNETTLHRALREGDTRYVEDAERVLEEVMRGLRLETLRTEWAEDVAGAFADVPSFLAGSPVSMRRKVIVTHEIAPMRLMICTTSSCGVDIHTLTRRGVCLLALVIALSRIRPVELYTFNAVEEQGGGGWRYGRDRGGKHPQVSPNYQSLVDIVRLPTSPIDIGLIAFCLINQGYTRAMTYSFLHHHDSHLLYQPPNRDLDECRRICGAQDADVVFPPIHLYDNYSNPTEWVKTKLAEILKLNEEQVEALT